MNLYETRALRDVTGPAIRPGGLALTERALAFCRLPGDALVLDVGCGSGATVTHLRHCYGLQAIGLDLSPTLLAEGRRREATLALLQGCAEHLPLRDARLAALFSECLLSLLADPAAALAEWHRALAADGFLVVSDLYSRHGRWGQGESISVLGCVAGAVSRDLLLARMQTAGFEVLLWEDHTPLLRQLAARLVWEHGSMAAFWQAAGIGCGGIPGVGRPGYYLLVAKKID